MLTLKEVKVLHFYQRMNQTLKLMYLQLYVSYLSGHVHPTKKKWGPGGGGLHL